MQHVFLAALLAQGGGYIETHHPSPPSREHVTISAECQGRKLSYAVNKPGPDLFEAITVGGKPLPQVAIGTLNDMIAGYMLDEVDLVSCDGTGDEYDVLVRVAVASGPEQHLISLGIKNGRLRQIR